MTLRTFTRLPETDGGGDISRVRIDFDGKPVCLDHGAMNKVSPDGIWRCITTTSATAGKRCNAGCLEERCTHRWAEWEPMIGIDGVDGKAGAYRECFDCPAVEWL